MSLFYTETYKHFKALRGCEKSKIYSWPTLNGYNEIITEHDWDCANNELIEVRSILSYLAKNLSKAKQRNQYGKFNIDLDYVFDIGEDQNWECALTGDSLEFKRGGQNWLGKWCNPKSCTVDRIDSSKGYVKGNIQLVTWEANCLKQHLDNTEFIDFCKRVYLNM